MRKVQPSRRAALAAGGVILVVAVAISATVVIRRLVASLPDEEPRPAYRPRLPLDAGGYKLAFTSLKPWAPDATLEEISASWRQLGHRNVERIDRQLAGENEPEQWAVSLLHKALFLNFEGDPDLAYAVLEQARSQVGMRQDLADKLLYSLVFFQGVTALRRGENDNCIRCRGESSCILPIVPAAYYTNPEGSRVAIKHFAEYLEQFPDDLEVRWLLNLAHMTLGEYPGRVDPKYLIPLDRYFKSEFDIGKFRDVGHLVGVNRFNLGGGSIMEDFDGDGRLDIATTSFDPTLRMALFRNEGDGTFVDRAGAAGLGEQLGGLYCVQADYDNDGRADIFVARGAWVAFPMRPSLLRNNGDGTFADVTKEAGLLGPVNSNSASWADFDNDGFLDLFVCCERQPSRLYRNRGDGTFQDVAAGSGVLADGPAFCKGAAWVDIDNDDDPDLFLNHLDRPSQLFRNDRGGHFTEVTSSLGIDGPTKGFSCWAWDYDNDGWLDIFATCYDRSLGDVVKGLIGRPHGRQPNKLFRNLEGKGFEDVTKAAGLDMVFAAMGSNYGDLDNDGFLDIYLGTGEPSLSTLVPNRMFRNVGGRRFAEITGSSGTGHIQKGHGVACGDWDRDGDVDVFIGMGGAVNGDKYHNILFQNPGQGNHWLTVKLVGAKSNRSAIGARIKVITAGEAPSTVHRHVSTGSSFGANPLQQHFGLGRADRVALLEVHWPTGGTTQVFRDIAADQAIEVTENSADYRALDWRPISLPK